MGIVAVLLDKAREFNIPNSDNGLAIRLGVTRQVVSQWRAGRAYPSEEHIAQLAVCAKANVAEWLVRINAERSTGAAKKASWAELARRLGAAAVIALALLPLIGGPTRGGIGALSNAQARALYLTSRLKALFCRARARFQFA